MDHAPYRLAERLEAHLGDPADPATLFSAARCVELDEREQFPAELCEQLEAWGIQDYYVPVAHGGRLESYEQLLQLIRTVARRDLTVAIGHGKTYLGGVCVWTSGSAGQAAALAADIEACVPVSLGLTERAHGSDLLAGELVAEPDGTGGYLVSGEKWLINNATRGSVLSLLTRTAEAGGPRGFSVLLVDKRTLGPEHYRCLDKIPTHGIRGADISGIAFDRAPVPASAVVGTVGGGVETVLKALQLTRTMCAALSLGAADHALTLALDFAEQRELYGRRLIDLPKARRTLADAAADVLVGEALALVASRSVHTLTGELSITAAVTKYLVPTGTEGVIAELTRLLGARAFLKDVYAGGMFQKIDRDHRIVGLFDGNTLVNLNSLISQFRSLVRAYRRGLGDPAGAEAAFRLAAPQSELDPARLSLVARHGSSVIASLPGTVAALRAAAATEPALKGALASAERLQDRTAQVHDAMERHQNAVGDVPVEAFETAKRYALCFAGAACLGLWAHNREEAAAGRTGRLWQDGRWLRPALDRVLRRLGESTPDDPEGYEELLGLLRGARAGGELFSLLPLALAGARTTAGTTIEGASC
ncbi:acyl-CoA dehydrogenase [Kitasatospora herbaricolor]|uniref:acyl-CoA dehydrogenase n=1 Tax=Kitasatospora herbaricolor TaxID=68217 RepID=UPI001748A5A6|nr:acyl-CoA dehydrogenase [Kitasatospora herbaricolor]MDQ0309868.1 alkylation response protein AidB-like acyl-CoA dehydrogenase [Kitasatospora herbaricolor]GGU99066.1 acyl-CoA dehydrogenase [Kitasatospora herbaricolor]